MNDEHWIMVLYQRYRELYGDPTATPGSAGAGHESPSRPAPAS